MPLDQATAAKRTILAGHNRTESAKVGFHPCLGICIVAPGRRSRPATLEPATPLNTLNVKTGSGSENPNGQAILPLCSAIPVQRWRPAKWPRASHREGQESVRSR
jgi:hypothetical protein